MTHDELLLFGERLRKRRIALGVTQESVAEQAGITLRWYQRVERGDNTVSIDTLLALSRVYSLFAFSVISSIDTLYSAALKL